MVAVHDLDELKDAISDKARIDVVSDIEFGNEAISIVGKTVHITSSVEATFDGGKRTSFFEVGSGGKLTLEFLRLMRGWRAGKGGAISITASELVMRFCTLDNNVAFGDVVRQITKLPASQAPPSPPRFKRLIAHDCRFACRRAAVLFISLTQAQLTSTSARLIETRRCT